MVVCKESENDIDSPDYAGGRGRGNPTISVIIPVWNRQGTIRRCLDSCLSQDCDSFEVVAVDDGSTDCSLQIMESYSDARLRIVKLPENRGMTNARNEGSRAAHGDWFAYLDSDDVFLPGYLRRIEMAVQGLEPEIGVVISRYLRDEGGVSPESWPGKDVLAFGDFLRWWNAMIGSTDMQIVRRHCTWQEFPFPSGRTNQMLMNLRMYSRYKILVLGEPGGMVYTDVADRRSSDISPAARKRWQTEAPDVADSLASVMREFGPVLRRHAPRRYREVLRAVAFSLFAGGDRWSGLKRILRYLREYPLCIKGWMYLALGLMGPAMVVWGKAWSLAKNRAGR